MKQRIFVYMKLFHAHCSTMFHGECSTKMKIKNFIIKISERGDIENFWPSGGGVARLVDASGIVA